LELINTLAHTYAEQFSSPEDAILKQIAEETYKNHPHAHMLSGHLQGQFLQLISKIAKPNKILEVGTFIGYSAICLAKGLQEDGQLHTIELREEDAATAIANFNKANLQDKIILHTGNALEIIPSLEHEWDIVFIDADKVGYMDYYKLVIPRVKKGGMILADNVLFHGEVLEKEIKGKNAKAIHAFNEMVRQDASADKVMLTLRDGLLLILKK
jgi:predicted O-methyltransferase YrrM